MNTHAGPHDGLTCAEAESLLALRMRQLDETRSRLRDEPRAKHPARLVKDITDTRRELRRVTAERDAIIRRLAYREQQATARLTPDDERAEQLAAVAAVEAVIDRRPDDLERVAPTTIAAMRAQLTALVCGLAAVARRNPDILTDLRAAILAGPDNNTTEEHA